MKLSEVVFDDINSHHDARPRDQENRLSLKNFCLCRIKWRFFSLLCSGSCDEEVFEPAVSVAFAVEAFGEISFPIAAELYCAGNKN